MTQTEIALVVHEAVSEALALEPDEVTGDATLTDELGAESIDLLDVLFRIERGTGVKIQAADLADHIQGGITDEEFSDEDDIVSPVGLAHLASIMPQIDTAEREGGLRAEDVLGLFTVQNLVDLVAQRAALASA